MTQQEIELFTDHFQILFGDADKAPLVDTSSLWDKPGLVVALDQRPELVGLGTARYGGVTRLTVFIADEPQEVRPGWERMGDFVLAVPSGRVVFWAPEIDVMDGARTVSLEPGLYLGVASSRGTESITDEMVPEGDDHYAVAIWPADRNGFKE